MLPPSALRLDNAPGIAGFPVGSHSATLVCPSDRCCGKPIVELLVNAATVAMATIARRRSGFATGCSAGEPDRQALAPIVEILAEQGVIEIPDPDGAPPASP